MPTKKRGNNEGSYYKLANGSFQAAITYRTANDVARRKYFTGPTKRHVQNMVKAWKDAGGATGPDASTVTFAAYVETWLTGRPALRARESTIHGYRRFLALYTPHLGETRLQRLTTGQIQAAMGAIAKTHAPETLRQSRRVLSSALGDAVKDGLLTVNPVKDTTPPRVSKAKRQVLTAEEAMQLLADAERRADYRWPLWAVLLNTGLRIGEVTGLKWQDIDIPGRGLSVVQQLQRSRGPGRAFYLDDPKTETSARRIPLTAAAIRALERQRVHQLELQLAAAVWRNDWQLVFTALDGRPLGSATVADQFHRALTAAGLPAMRLHDIRHTTATLLLKQGVPMKVISEILGHANIHTTMNTYSHVDQPLLEAAMAKLESAIGGHS